jgi:hypothetical protein
VTASYLYLWLVFAIISFFEYRVGPNNQYINSTPRDAVRLGKEQVVSFHLTSEGKHM